MQLDPATMVSAWESSSTFPYLIVVSSRVFCSLDEDDMTRRLIDELNCAMQEWLLRFLNGAWLNKFSVNYCKKTKKHMNHFFFLVTLPPNEFHVSSSFASSSSEEVVVSGMTLFLRAAIFLLYFAFALESFATLE